ncbi:DNA repair protein RadA [Acetobacterium paludosum]|uniref:DNA repair protein RadA n=1 Tax=Acetobacterium paludosum TaxID=52693 RepID=A0A923KY31_9FIRM|nr:DNA repair protein RadA [Acetobacterium paludosum]MBC3889131.1 DNA repair protein RadA [Acetobacterium paludosum]
MAKKKSIFVCQNCGYDSPKWMGKCPECNQWNTMVEELDLSKLAGKENTRERGVYSKPKSLAEITYSGDTRYPTQNEEFDRVLGGGIVPGGMILLGGDPGIGKSTLLLQTTEALGNQGYKILYISGEESEQQLKMRGERMNVKSENIFFLSEINIPYLLTIILEERPDIVIIDSIQTMYSPDISSAPGSVSQIRENTGALMQLAKKDNISMILVGHVTKEGNIAGPRVLEHMVDTVLYFEGEKYHTYRILRGEKNRFGSTNEIGIFEMTESGLQPVANPSEMMLDSRPENTCGSVVVPCMEGSRPLLIELQGLISPCGFGNPRRMSTGMDCNRMVLLMAIMEKRLGIQMQSVDAYINVVGGIKIDEPALDLGVIAVLYSSLRNFQIPADLMILGEVGLTGEVRNIQNMEKRLIEGKKLGFKRCIIPKGNQKGLNFHEMEIFPVDNIRSALDSLL